MPAPRWLARVNRRVTNHLLGPLATRLPRFGIITHTGRKTGRQYHTPVNIFPHEDGYVIALTYGPDAEWVRNVLASGGCTVTTQGKRLRLTRPRRFHDETRRAVPRPVRLILGLLNVSDFLALSIDHDGQDAVEAHTSDRSADRRTASGCSCAGGVCCGWWSRGQETSTARNAGEKTAKKVRPRQAALLDARPAISIGCDLPADAGRSPLIGPICTRPTSWLRRRLPGFPVRRRSLTPEVRGDGASIRRTTPRDRRCRIAGLCLAVKPHS